MPGLLARDGADSDPTANTLNERAVFVEAHFGHFSAASLFMDLTSRSNLVWQDEQVYS
jgi:hypothetical protein